MTRLGVIGLVVFVTIAAVGGLSSSRADDVVGSGEWQSLSGEAIRGGWSVDLRRSGDLLAGTIKLTDSPLFSEAAVSGSIDGRQVVLGVMAQGVRQATFTGQVTGDSVSGEWKCPTIDDSGVWYGALKVTQSTP